MAYQKPSMISTTGKIETGKFLPVTDIKHNLSNAITKAVKQDMQTSKYLNVKDTKRHRRDVIVNTILRYTRN